MAIDIDEVAGAVARSIPARAEFDDGGREEARRFVRATVMGLFEDHFTTKEIVRELTGFENGYGCWLDWLAESLPIGLDALPSGYDERTKGKIEGSFRATKRLLFELEKHKYGLGEPLKYGGNS